MKTFPKINRPTWLALWAQGRRRRRLQAAQVELLPAPVLRAEYPGILKWDWTLANPYRWQIWLSWDNGATWVFNSEYWTSGDDRDFTPDGGSSLHYVVGVDEFGKEITKHSNPVRPDDAPAPTPNAPVIISGSAEWEATEPGWFDVSVQWTFDHGSYPPASIEVFVSVDGGAYSNTGAVSSLSQLFTIVQACEGESDYRFKLRYHNGMTDGPFSNEYLVSCQL